MLLLTSCLLFICLRSTNSYLRNEVGARAVRAVGPGVGAQAEERVVGGAAAGSALPWFALLHPAGTPPSNAVCGGTLVSPRHVVTAAHCLPVLQQPAVTLGVLNRCRLSESGRREMAVASALAHPDYSPGAQGGSGLNDIAVLTLRQPAVGFQVVALPRVVSGSSLTEIFLGGAGGVPWEPAAAGRAALVAGFGLRREGDRRSQPCQLQVGSVRVLGRQQCMRSRVPNKYALEPTLLCAGLRSGGVDTCAGDSGGGLLIRENGNVTLIGIVSFGYGCAERRTPALYTRVASFMPWLREQLGNTADQTAGNAASNQRRPAAQNGPASPWGGYLWKPIDRWNAWFNPG